jgi:2-C-methyl-D-erythritol 4-phosphate cytidylyltransferase/2-C-methyl-D-erythritol 2,4-cyclodiphosphate synthase
VALVERVVRATTEHGAAVPVVAVPDTVREDDGSGFAAATVERSRLRLAQTPQGARTDWLVEALEAAERDGVEVTDEGAALERSGRKVRLVAGEVGNVKITTADDLSRARRLADGGSGMRVGIGFDIHRFGGDGPLMLGGVRFEGEPGLLGHSDADVVLHAAMDAVLGAAALGDIGVHFPPGEPGWRGAASTDLARTVARMVSDAGFVVSNVDVTLLAERPRIRERVDQMRRTVAECLGLAVERVAIKATTLESLGCLGRGEGIACQSVAMLRPREAGE